MIQDVLVPLIGAAFALAVVLVLCYAFSRFMGKRMNNVSASRNIKVQERVALGQDKALMIVKVGAGTYLLGVTGQHIRILRQLNEDELTVSPPVQKSAFSEVLNMAMRAKRGESVDTPHNKDDRPQD